MRGAFGAADCAMDSPTMEPTTAPSSGLRPPSPPLKSVGEKGL
ncbi:MAG: hypothetical protein QOC81_3046, partial [Thermoanaerobaculia bacterium]|nr:hypothetical protein [Thermoanaerobaculia bacterium]